MAGGGAVVMNILIWVVASFLLFYALAMSKKGVLG
jgi:hypothetical protein